MGLQRVRHGRATNTTTTKPCAHSMLHSGNTIRPRLRECLSLKGDTQEPGCAWQTPECWALGMFFFHCPVEEKNGASDALLKCSWKISHCSGGCLESHLATSWGLCSCELHDGLSARQIHWLFLFFKEDNQLLKEFALDTFKMHIFYWDHQVRKELFQSSPSTSL